MVDAATNTKWVLRRARPSDQSFLRDLYAGTREEELASIEWSYEQRRAFCDFQFEAQRSQYSSAYPDSATLVIEIDGEPVGRLILDRSPLEWTVLDITITSNSRRRGVGTDVLRSIIDEARRAGADVSLSVLIDSPARRLYERLGFVGRTEQFPRIDMVWSSSQHTEVAPSGVNLQ